MDDCVNILGCMSGTSLDGLDLCLVRWNTKDYSYQILKTDCIPYNSSWKNRLKNAVHLDGESLTKLDHEYGAYLGKCCAEFIRNSKNKVDAIGSHGQTVFHQPQMGFGLQIGNGPHIFAATGITVVCDFRSQDIAYGGQGAPLVPIGDQLLFSSYDACLNLGGFCNISHEKDSQRIAYDIGAFNMPLNAISNRVGLEFDANGDLARKGKLIPELLHKWNDLAFYKKEPPKSLGWEWCEENFLNKLDQLSQSYAIADLLYTYNQHAVDQTSHVLNKNNLKSVLITGGGAFNRFFIESLRQATASKIIVPNNKLVNYKEALIFSLLALLRIEGKVNILKEVTGASRNHSSGIIYGENL